MRLQLIHRLHHTQTVAAMPLIQVRDVPEATMNALKVRAAEPSLTLTAYLRLSRESSPPNVRRRGYLSAAGGHLLLLYCDGGHLEGTTA